MTEVEGSRGVPPLNAKSPVSGRLRLLLLLIVVLVFVAGLGFVVLKKVQKTSAEDQAAAEASAPKDEAALPSKITPLPASLRPEAVEAAAAAASSADAADEAESSTAASGSSSSTLAPLPGHGAAGSVGADGQPALSPEEQAAADLAARRQRAPVLAWSADDAGVAASASQAGDQAPLSESEAYMQAMNSAMQAATSMAQPAGAAGEKKQSLNSQLKADDFEPAVASRIEDMNFTMPEGTMARCGLRKAFNSQLSGSASCVLTAPVYSANGRFVLWEAGSEVTGVYETGQLKAGATRVFVIWTKVRTPYGVVIKIDSPATDGLGRAGIGGKVNNHFWQRFGAAMLVSVVDDLASYAVAQQRGASSEQTNINFGSTAQSSNEAASIIVQNSVGIPPTLDAKVGSIVNISLARDLYFGNVYGFQPKAALGVAR
ncbi:TrbI/VirB10 family protein [Xanthomonas arboricola]|uniref:TrbI/VirB10 family protein n=1 Tax=Xanthomonas TaxID=338 RepID=UPI00069F9EF3|nr:TrbI/VirB10 family protein [Xanthomonas arboricola]